MIMDWCEMSSHPTIHGLQGQDQRGWDGFTGAYSGRKKVIEESWHGGDATGIDTIHGWCIAVSWLLASTVEYVNFHFVFLCNGEYDNTRSVCIIYTHLSGEPN